ncbi:MAG TPA: SAM-dependent methyltransferase [Chitinophagaceae bacterium]|nr:SAM-dependent methyltransferase [Chitinophagaceae bacterium]
MTAIVYLIPSLLHEEGLRSIPPYITDIVKQCQVLFVENERTSRRYLKTLAKEIVIDNYEWFTMAVDDDTVKAFRKKIKEGKTIGIISEAGCPGIADPGQQLVAIAHEMNVEVKPLVGPNSILLALMASGMNGQQFKFNGYLPIKDPERHKAIKELESESSKKNCTQIFIETPYRNNQLMDALLHICQPSTKICLAVDLTSEKEFIKTRSVAEWKKDKPDIHKRPAIFLLYAYS